MYFSDNDDSNNNNNNNNNDDDESLPFGRGSRVTSRGSRVNGPGSKNPPQLFLNVVKSKFRVYWSFRCLFYFYVTPTGTCIICRCSTRVRDGPFEKLWGEGEFSSRRNFFSLSNSLYEFFSGPCMNIS